MNFPKIELKRGNLKNFISTHQITGIVALIIIASFFLRVWNLSIIPGGFALKELETTTAIKDLSLNNFWLEGPFYKAAYIYVGFFWSKVFGLTVFNLRLLSAIIGGLTVWATYLFIGKWFSRKIAIFSSVLLAISSFHITVSRLIIPEIISPLILLSIFIALTYAYRNKNIWLFGLSGFLMGVGFYTSAAFVLVPLLFLITGFYFFLRNKKFFTSYKEELLAFGAGFMASIIPYLVSLIQNPKIYLEVFVLPNSLIQLVINISQIPNILFIEAPTDFFSGLGTEPLLDPLIFITSIFGLFFALMSIGRRKYFFLVVWLLVFFGYAVLNTDLGPLATLGIIPVIFAFSALILDYILDRWFETFPYDQKARLFAIGLISIFFALSALYNFDRYFVAYKNSLEVRKEFSVEPPIPLIKGEK